MALNTSDILTLVMFSLVGDTFRLRKSNSPESVAKLSLSVCPLTFFFSKLIDNISVTMMVIAIGSNERDQNVLLTKIMTVPECSMLSDVFALVVRFGLWYGELLFQKRNGNN